MLVSKLAMLRLWRAPRVPLARGFAALPATTAEGGVAATRKQTEYYATILEKYPRQVRGAFSDEALNRTVAFLTDRGISRTKAMRAVANFVPLVTYSTELLESKISWLEELGLSHDKINVAILRNPSMLGHTTERYTKLVDWFLAHGVPKAKLPFLFTIGPNLLSFSSDTLDAKLDFFREVGLTDEQITRILKTAPQVLCYSTESMKHKLDYLVELGIPRELLPQLLPNAPDILGLKTTRIQETVDALDEMFGDEAGCEALQRHFRLLSYNVEGLRRAFNYLVSVVGLTPEQLWSSTRCLSRSRDDILRPRFKFLKGQGVNTAARTTWIVLSDRVFIQTYPGYEAYLAEYKARQTKKTASARQR